MGSLAWAGAIGGAGEALQENVAGRRATRMQDDEQAHQVQLQTQRDKAAETRASNRETFEVGLATTRSEFETGMAVADREFEAGESGLERTHTEAETKKQRGHEATQEGRNRESREFIAMVQRLGGPGGGFGGGAGTRGKAGDWDIEIRDEVNLETGEQQSPFYAKHPSGVALELVGDRLVHVNDDELRAKGLRKFKNPKVQRAEEAKLYNDLIRGEDTGQEFLREYNYLPHSYMTEKWKQDSEGIGGQLWDYFLDRRGGRAGLPGEYEDTRLPRSTGDVEADAEAQRAGPGGTDEGYWLRQGGNLVQPGRRGDSVLMPGEDYVPPPEPIPGEEIAEVQVPDIARRTTRGLNRPPIPIGQATGQVWDKTKADLRRRFPLPPPLSEAEVNAVNEAVRLEELGRRGTVY